MTEMLDDATGILDIMCSADKTEGLSGGRTTVVGLVLDRSGSMAGDLSKETIGAYNSTLQQFRDKDWDNFDKDAEEEILVVATVFDNEINVIRNGEDVQGVKDITESEAFPRGMTALFDAVGITVSTMKNVEGKYKDMAYLLVVMSDGQENASREYTHEDIKNIFDKGKELGNWTFVFYGCEENSLTTMSKVGAFTTSYDAHNYSGTGGKHMLYASASYMSSRTKGLRSVDAWGEDTTGGDPHHSVTTTGGDNA